MSFRFGMITFSVLLCFSASSQDSIPASNEVGQLKRFSVSANPSGLVYFGPLLNAEVGFGNHFRVNTHFRFPRFGLMNHILYTPDEITGYGLGLGSMCFFGKKRKALYVGLLLEYSKMLVVDYPDPTYYPYERQFKHQYYVIAVHSGYRFRFGNGIFFNLGVYVFMYSETYPFAFKIPGYHSGNERSFPILYPDIRFGFEF
jgi:hypothetical protein